LHLIRPKATGNIQELIHVDNFHPMLALHGHCHQSEIFRKADDHRLNFAHEKANLFNFDAVP
jgi:hypothetical protein